MKKPHKQVKSEIFYGSGNVFADLGLEDAEELLAKSWLVFRIDQVIKNKKLTQKQAAKVLGIDQPKISNLMRGRLEGFSIERLFRFLNALGQDIEISVKPKPRSRGLAEIRVVAG